MLTIDLKKDIQPLKQKLRSTLSQDDYISIIRLISKHRDDLAQIIRQIDETKYDFDKMTLQNTKNMKQSDAKIFIKKMVSTFITEGVVDYNTEFPNMIVSCAESVENTEKKNRNTEKIPHCSKGNLIVQNLDEMCSLLAYDLTNELKSKYFFDNIWANLLVDYFNFIVRPHETIFISPVKS